VPRARKVTKEVLGLLEPKEAQERRGPLAHREAPGPTARRGPLAHREAPGPTARKDRLAHKARKATKVTKAFKGIRAAQARKGLLAEPFREPPIMWQNLLPHPPLVTVRFSTMAQMLESE